MATTAKPMNATAATSPQSTQFSSPTHHQFGSAVTSPRAPSTPINQARSPSEPVAGAGRAADYSRSFFENGQSKNAKTAATASAPNISGTSGGGVAPGGDIFADILGQQGYNFASKPSSGTRTINAMRKEEMVRDMDPDKLKILEWVGWNSFVLSDEV